MATFELKVFVKVQYLSDKWEQTRFEEKIAFLLPFFNYHQNFLPMCFWWSPTKPWNALALPKKTPFANHAFFGKISKIGKIICSHRVSIENLPNNVYIEKKFRFQTFRKTTWCYPKKQQKQQKQHFSKICNFRDLAYTHIFCCRSRTTPTELAPFFLERGKIHKNWFRVIFGRF